jgi:hypothetical protein
MTSQFLFNNNATTTLSAGINTSATTITVAVGTGALFPSPSGAQYFALVLISQTNNLITEICYCTSRTGDSLTVTRGQEGTVANSWLIGDTAQNQLTAGQMQQLLQALSVNPDVGTYTNATVTANAQGLITAVSSGAAPIFTRFFEYAGQAVATNINAAHGFGFRPKLYGAYLVCVTANAGYSVGDEVILPSTTYTGAGGGTGSFMGVSANATLVEMKCSSTATISVGDGTTQYITPGDWTVTLRAWG